MDAQTIDEGKLNSFIGQMLGDIGAAMGASLVLVGDKLGLYRAMAAAPVTPEELAAATATNARMVREWLNTQAASRYVTYDEATGRYALPPEQAMVFANEDSPVFLAGAFDIIAATIRGEDRLTKAFRDGKGMGWHEHHPCLFCGTERFFRTSYKHNLVQSWLPALDGVVPKLEHGARVADVGCGHGASTVLMAQAYPNSRFTGFDYHAPSIAAAREAAERAGVSDRCTFEVAAAKNYPGTGYDLVAFFDCLHDMGDPVGAAEHVRQSLAPDGTWMIVEPMAGDRVSDNLNPVGRIYYAASTMICTPASLSQEVGAALGAQAGEARLRAVVNSAGYGSFRRATETPFNLILEARP